MKEVKLLIHTGLWQIERVVPCQIAHLLQLALH
jgi:hypothetical protein